MIQYPKGTKEYLVIDLTDRLHAISDLSTYAVTYTIKDSDGAIVTGYDNVNALADDMTVRCLFDSSTWSGGRYSLYIKLAISPEFPLLGPFYFGIDE